MKTLDVDARRYVWCKGQAIWRISMPITALLEDLRGALADGQEGLARHTARNIGTNCAVVLNLVLFYERPFPPARMRAAWALERVASHPLGADCMTLVRSPRTLSAGELGEIAERLITSVRDIVGDVPDPMSPEGYFPALATARDWLKLAETVGVEGFLPKEWTSEEAH
jgi:hypothetical protein